jgi:hypothetical protein
MTNTPIIRISVSIYLLNEAVEYHKNNPHLRLGQAIYDHLGLEKMNQHRDQLNTLYQKDGEEAMALFHKLFELS